MPPATAELPFEEGIILRQIKVLHSLAKLVLNTVLEHLPFLIIYTKPNFHWDYTGSMSSVCKSVKSPGDP